MVSTWIGFGMGLVELAGMRNDVVTTSADTYRSFALNKFVGKYPDRYFEFEIAEQGMLAASAAVTAEGCCVFSVGYSPSLSIRRLEQIRTFVAYPNLNVKVVAGLSGLSGDTDGVTRQGAEDIGIVRTIPNMALPYPADAVAAKALVKVTTDLQGSVYLRLGRGVTPVVYKENQRFEFGKAIHVHCYGREVVIVVCGPCMAEAARTADQLKEDGIMVTVLDMYMIGPLDVDTLTDCCEGAGSVMTVEDGTVCGLGSTVAEALVEHNVHPKHFKRLGMTTFGIAGSLLELLGSFGLDSKGIAESVQSLQ